MPDELIVDSDYCWKNVPGGRNVFGAITQYAAPWVDCGKVAKSEMTTCAIPTGSAIGIDMPPDAPMPLPGAKSGSPFDDYIAAERDLEHVGLSPETAAWLLQHLGAADANSV
jgi:hypothetical protein